MFEIRDWANNLLFNGKTFDTFEDGWDFLYEKFPDYQDGDFDDYYVLEKQDKKEKRYLDPFDPRQ